MIDPIINATGSRKNNNIYGKSYGQKSKQM